MVSPDRSGREPGRTPAADDEVALDQRFGRDGLPGLRAAVAQHAGDLGAGRRCAGYLMVIANELASNAVLHGGGGGRLRLWRDGDVIVCQVADTGPGLPQAQAAGRRRPALDAGAGRGLWLVRQMAEQVDIRSDSQGTTVTATVMVNTTGR